MVTEVTYRCDACSNRSKNDNYLLRIDLRASRHNIGDRTFEICIPCFNEFTELINDFLIRQTPQLSQIMEKL
jgi:hypothetical protein